MKGTTQFAQLHHLFLSLFWHTESYISPWPSFLFLQSFFTIFYCNSVLGSDPQELVMPTGTTGKVAAIDEGNMEHSQIIMAPDVTAAMWKEQ